METILVFDDPNNFTHKHPLENKWTLWYDDPQMSKASLSWEQNLKNIATFDTVEDFWGVMNNIKKPSEINPGANYHLFKYGIKPMWEEPENRNGGKWTFSQKATKQRGADLDKLWLNMMMALVGEQFSSPADISGAVVSIRKAADRISLWTKSLNDSAKTVKSGQECKTFLGIPPSEKIYFQSHSDTAAKTSSSGVAPSKYTC